MLEYGLAPASGQGLKHAYVHPPRPVHLLGQVANDYVGEAGAGTQAGDDGATRLPSRLVEFVQHGLGGAPVVADAGVVDARFDGCSNQPGLEAVKGAQGGSSHVVALHRLDEGVVVVRVHRLDIHLSSPAPQGAGKLVCRSHLAVSDGHLVHAGRVRQVLDGPAAHVAGATENDDSHAGPPSA